MAALPKTGTIGEDDTILTVLAAVPAFWFPLEEEEKGRGGGGGLAQGVEVPASEGP